MNRRTLLGAAATLPVLGLPGCQALGLTTPVMVNIHNETGVDRYVAVTAYSLDDDRQTYDEAVNAPAGNTASLGHLSSGDQLVRVALFERNVDEASTDGDAESGTDASGNGTGESETGSGESDDRLDESDDGVEAVEETFIDEHTQSLTVSVTEDGLELDVASRES